MIVEKMVATDGHILTNGEAYGKVIYLGCDDAAENWREITEEEYEKRMQAAGHGREERAGEAVEEVKE